MVANVNEHGVAFLTWLNAGLSAFDLVAVVILIIFLRRRLLAEQGGDHHMPQGMIHAQVGTVLLLMYACLAMTTALGAIVINLEMVSLILVVQFFAVALRAAITLVLLSWLAYTLEFRLKRRRA
jgi:hypothetical protein